MPMRARHVACSCQHSVTKLRLKRPGMPSAFTQSKAWDLFGRPGPGALVWSKPPRRRRRLCCLRCSPLPLLLLVCRRRPLPASAAGTPTACARAAALLLVLVPPLAARVLVLEHLCQPAQVALDLVIRQQPARQILLVGPPPIPRLGSHCSRLTRSTSARGEWPRYSRRTMPSAVALKRSCMSSNRTCSAVGTRLSRLYCLAMMYSSGGWAEERGSGGFSGNRRDEGWCQGRPRGRGARAQAAPQEQGPKPPLPPGMRQAVAPRRQTATAWGGTHLGWRATPRP